MLRRVRSIDVIRKRGPVRALAWLGRQRGYALAIPLALGVATPPLGAAPRPYNGEAVFALLAVAFLRLDLEALRIALMRPGPVIVATLWTSIAIPALFILAMVMTGAERIGPGLSVALVLQAAACPMMAAPALAALLGLDATLTLAALVTASAVAPATATVVVALADVDLAFSPVRLGATLAAFLLGSAALGLALRRLLGATTVARRREELDGINILILFVFISAVTGDVGIHFLARPRLTFLLTGLGFFVYAALLDGTWRALRRLGAKPALAVALLCAQRNMGLTLAAVGSTVGDVT